MVDWLGGRKQIRRVLIGVLALAALSAAGASGALASITGTGRTRIAARILPRSVPRLLAVAHRLGALSPQGRITFTLALRLPAQAALNAYVSGEYSPASPDYHHFLTPSQFGQRFGAPAGEVSAALAALRRMGFATSTPPANRLYVQATGSVAAVQRAFDTPLARFALPHLSGLAAHLSYLRTFYANTRPIRLPASLAGAVTGVVGLSDSALPMPQLALPTRAEVAHLDRVRPRSGTPVGQDGGATPCPQAQAAGGYTAPDLATAYNFNGLYAQGLHGEGMNAALVEFDDYHDSNVATVESCYGITTQVVRRLVDGGSGGPPAEGEAEDMADITTLLSLDPKLSHLYVYVAPITGEAAVLNEGNAELDLYNAFVTDDKAPVLSSSWGNCEELQSQAYNDLFANIAEEAAAQGQQIFDAAGDSGAVDCRGYPTPTSGSISVEQEAAVPWITGVGGTDLAQGSTVPGAGHYEAAWNDAGAGGGGQSAVWPMPAWQQRYLQTTGDRPPGEANSCGSPSGLCRMVPDIAMNADPDAGGAVNGGPNPAQFSGNVAAVAGSAGDDTYCGTTNCSLVTLIGGPPIPAGPTGAGDWYPIGGTSLATPTAAAAAVLWDQLARRDGLSGLGFLNPSLYRVAANAKQDAADFYTIGPDGYNNSDGALAGDANDNSNDAQYDTADCPPGCNPDGLYKATDGYSMADGLGAINVANLGASLIADESAVDLTPSAETLYGYVNGISTTRPVSVTSGYYGSAYTARSDASWLHVTRSGHVPGTLQWSADPAGLSAGSYTGHITVTDARGQTATLTVYYDVTPRAAISLSPTSLAFSEQAINSSGQPTTPTCGSTVWSDELIKSSSFKGGSYDTYSPDPNSLRTLTISNSGPAGSVLHYEVLYVTPTSSWLSQDLDPNGNPSGFQTTAGQPLVASTGALAAGQSAQVKLASVANSNALGGYPPMNQGTYHGIVQVEDLADPAVVDTVPVTLTLGDGRGTPTVSASPSSISLTLAPGASRTVDLALSDASQTCGYAYSMQVNAPWAAINPDLYSGTVSVPAATAPPSNPSDTGEGDGFTPVMISAAGLKDGTYHARIEINTQNAVPNPTSVPITLTVSSGSGGGTGSGSQHHPSRCPPAGGRLTPQRIGPLALGEPRATAQRRFAHHYSTRGHRYMEFFCLRPVGIRALYPPPSLLRGFSRAERRRLLNRIGMLSTSDRRYALRGVRPGMSLAAAKRRLHLGRPIVIGRNAWYLIRYGSQTGTLKVQRGRVGEVGIALRVLTGTRARARRFLAAFD